MISLLPYVAPFAVGLAGARYLGQPWTVAVGAGVVNSAVSNAAHAAWALSYVPDALEEIPATSSMPVSDASPPKKPGRKTRPGAAKKNGHRKYGAITMLTTYPAGMMVGDALQNPRREGMQARPNIGAAAASLIGIGIQAGATVGSSAISAGQAASGVRAQAALERQRMELLAEQAASELAATTGAHVTSAQEETKRTMIMAGAGVVGVLALGGLGLLLYRGM